jgi:predicted phosphate transport protein (TIGR00153 family)
MGFSIFPKNDKFFDLFSLSACNIRLAAEQFLDMVQEFSEVETKANGIKELETKGDSITHEIIDYLNASFITPIDREDIYALAGRLDDVLDEIEGVANRMHLFNVARPTAECVELVEIVARAAGILEKAIRNLRHFSGLKEFLVEINSLENQADQITRRMTAKLFHNGNGSTDVVNLIKWKEIYARLEHTADRMEDVANVIEDIAVKNT